MSEMADALLLIKKDILENQPSLEKYDTVHNECLSFRSGVSPFEFEINKQLYCLFCDEQLTLF